MVKDTGKRFLRLTEVQEILDVTSAQAYALVRSGELPAIQVGGRGQWRIEASVLEEYIAQQYSATREKFGIEAEGALGRGDAH